jgi:hypothetical protein
MTSVVQILIKLAFKCVKQPSAPSLGDDQHPSSLIHGFYQSNQLKGCKNRFISGVFKFTPYQRLSRFSDKSLKRFKEEPVEADGYQGG